MTNTLENEGTDARVYIVVTTAAGEVISHLEATTWDVDEHGRLFLYNETATRMNSVATYNTGAWGAVTRLTEEVYNSVMGSGEDKAKDEWDAKRKANRSKLRGRGL